MVRSMICRSSRRLQRSTYSRSSRIHSSKGRSLRPPTCHRQVSPGFTESLWIDELYTSNLFCGPTVVLLKTLFTDIHPPFYFVFIHFWNGLFGDSEIALRLPALLSGLASIWLIYRLGIMAHRPSTGLVAAFLLAVNPVHIWYSQEARPYATTILLTLLTVYAFWRLLETEQSFFWSLLYFCSLTALVFSHYYLAAFLVVLPLLAWSTKSPARVRILFGSIVLMVLVGLYLGAKAYLSHVPTTKSYLRAFDASEAYQLAFNWFLTGNSFTPQGNTTAVGAALLVVVQVLGVVAFLVGCARLLGSPARARGTQVLLLMLVLPACLLALTLVGKNQTYIQRSALPALPFFVLVIAAGIGGWRRLPLRRTFVGTAMTVQTGVLIAFFAHRGSWTVYKPNPDWKSVAAHLEHELATGAPSELLSMYLSPTPLTYYNPRFREVKHFGRNQQKLDRLLTRSAKLFGKDGIPGSWIRGWIEDHFGAYERELAAHKHNMQLAIHWVGNRDPLDIDKGEFWLLAYRGATPQRLRRVLDDPRTSIVSVQRFQSLLLYRVRRGSI